MTDRVTFYHNPMSRGRIVLWMLEECGAPYDVKVLDFEKREHKAPEYLAINPMGKIPAIVHRGTVVTEAAAVCAYLADAFPQAGLAPSASDPARGTYYRWMFFGAGCLEPALVDKLSERPPAKEGASGYGTYDNTVAALEKALSPGPFILGERFSAADVLLSSEIIWGTLVKALEPRPIFDEYRRRCSERPAFRRAFSDWPR